MDSHPIIFGFPVRYGHYLYFLVSIFIFGFPVSSRSLVATSDESFRLLTSHLASSPTVPLHYPVMVSNRSGWAEIFGRGLLLKTSRCHHTAPRIPGGFLVVLVPYQEFLPTNILGTSYQDSWLPKTTWNAHFWGLWMVVVARERSYLPKTTTNLEGGIGARGRPLCHI